MSTFDDYEESTLECYCGWPAKLRTSNTLQNPFRLFYNCPNEIPEQCGFFCWTDEHESSGNRHSDEPNLANTEFARRVLEILDEVQQEYDNEKAEWEREKAELTLKLATLESQLEDIQNRIQMANESRLMPPLDTLTLRDDEDEDALVIHTL